MPTAVSAAIAAFSQKDFSQHHKPVFKVVIYALDKLQFFFFLSFQQTFHTKLKILYCLPRPKSAIQ